MESVLAILWAPRFSGNYRRFVLRERLMFTSTVSYLEGRTREQYKMAVSFFASRFL